MGEGREYEGLRKKVGPWVRAQSMKGLGRR